MLDEIQEWIAKTKSIIMFEVEYMYPAMVHVKEEYFIYDTLAMIRYYVVTCSAFGFQRMVFIFTNDRMQDGGRNEEHPRPLKIIRVHSLQKNALPHIFLKARVA